jgi:hypothetical protein
MAGVVVVAVIAIAVPSLALGNSSQPAKPASTAATVECPLVGAATTAPKHDPKVNSRHHRRHRHRKPLGKHGATGATGPTNGCPPPPCIVNGAVRLGTTSATGATRLPCLPIPCPAMTGSTGTSGAPGPALICRPIPCLYIPQDPHGSTGATGALCPCWIPPATGSTTATGGQIAMICRPLPCPLASTVKRAKKGVAIVACAPIPVCPLGAKAGTSASTSAASVCAPCPPEPVANAVRAVLHACPESAGGPAVSTSSQGSSVSNSQPSASSSDRAS